MLNMLDLVFGAGLPLSHVVLANTEEAVSRFKESLLGVGRLAATVSSSSPR